MSAPEGLLPTLRAAAVALASLTLLTGVAYPLLVTAIAQAAFPERARGSLVVRGDRVVGSRLVGQPFEHPAYVWGRPSATKPTPYDASASAGSNLGPTSPALRDAARERLARFDGAGPVPVDLVTASGSGLDPHVSWAGAQRQAARIAAARGVDPARVRATIDAAVERGGGPPRVNVLLVNLALDEALGAPGQAP